MNKPIVLAYRADWNASALPASRIDYAPLTHIAHAFAVVERGAVRFPDSKRSRDLINAAHRHGVAVTLAIGGAGSNAELSAVCATESGTTQLAESIAAHVETFGYDGADIDWEHPANATDAARLTRFALELRRVLPRPRLVTMATPATDWDGKWYDAPALVPHIDWFAVMAYDFYGAWSDRAGYHSALFADENTDPALCGSAAIAYWKGAKKVTADKLLLGVPLYARGFRTKAWHDAVPVRLEQTNNVSDKSVETPYRALLGGGRTDAKAVCATWETERGAVISSGDNIQTARTKAKWARAQGLAGLFAWELSQDGAGAASVLRAIGC